MFIAVKRKHEIHVVTTLSKSNNSTTFKEKWKRVLITLNPRKRWDGSSELMKTDVLETFTFWTLVDDMV
jgi:hypothetical protein